MIKLNDFEKQGLKISWKLIDIGFKGSKEFYGQLTTEENN